MANLYIGCLGDSYRSLHLCKGVENCIIELFEEKKDIELFIRKLIPRNKIVGDKEVMAFFMLLNKEFRGIIEISMIQGFCAYHRTHEEHGNKIYLEIR